MSGLVKCISLALNLTLSVCKADSGQGADGPALSHRSELAVSCRCL